MDDVLARFWADLTGRLHGPMTFRFILQPAMAMLYALRDGMKDAREDQPPYFWAIFTRPHERLALLREGWQAMTRVIVLGVVMDTVYQLVVTRWLYPMELVFIVVLLAFVPYLLLRGVVNRIGRAWMHSPKVPTR